MTFPAVENKRKVEKSNKKDVGINDLASCVLLKYDVLKSLPDLKDIDDLKSATNAVYKVCVITGDQLEANTAAPIFISFVNKDITTPPCVLQHSAFAKPLVRGSTMKFMIQTAKMDNIESVIIQLVNSSGNESWYLKELKIQDIETKRNWFCQANHWFSQDKEDGKLCRIIKVTSNDEGEIKYGFFFKVKEAFNGPFNVPLYIKLYGSKRNTRKIPLEFQELCVKNEFYEFVVLASHVGIIHRIRVGIEFPESEKENKNCSILITRIFIKSQDEEFNFYTAINTRILGLSGSEKDTFLDIPCAAKDLEYMNPINEISIRHMRELTEYDIMLWKYDSQFINVSSTVFVQMFGQVGKWTRVFKISDLKKITFDSTDVFRVTGQNVGPLKKIRIWHNKAGVASAWHLEKVKIIRYLTNREIFITIAVMKRQGKLPIGMDVVDGKVIINPMAIQQNAEQSCLENKPLLGQKQLPYREAGGDVAGSSLECGSTLPCSSSMGKDLHQTFDLPYAEETLFECHTWLTLEDGDQTIQKVLSLSEKKYLSSPIQMRFSVKSNQ